MPPLTDSPWCYTHSPDRAGERAAARKRGGDYRKPRPVAGSPPSELRTVPDIMALLEHAMRMAMAGSVPPARTLAYIASVAFKGLEVGSIEERLVSLEAAAGQRRAS